MKYVLSLSFAALIITALLGPLESGFAPAQLFETSLTKISTESTTHKKAHQQKDSPNLKKSNHNTQLEFQEELQELFSWLEASTETELFSINTLKPNNESPNCLTPNFSWPAWEALIREQKNNNPQEKKLTRLHDEQAKNIIQAFYCISEDDRDNAEQILIDNISLKADSELTAFSLELLNTLHQFDRFRDANKAYLWALFAQQLARHKAYKTSHFLAEKAVEYLPNYRDAWIILANNSIILKQWENCGFYLKQASQLDPSNPIISYLFGEYYFLQNKFTESDPYFLSATSSPYRIESLQRLAESKMEQQLYNEAVYFWEQLFVEDSKTIPAAKELVVLYTEHLNKPKSAEQYLVALEELAGNDPEVRELINWTETLKGISEK